MFGSPDEEQDPVVEVGFDEGDAGVIDDCRDICEYCGAPVRIVVAGGEGAAVSVGDDDLIAAEEFYGEFFDIDGAKRHF